MNTVRWCFTLLLFLVGTSSHAAYVVPMDINDLYGDAAIVFSGQCLSQEVKLDEESQIVVTLTTFKVKEAFKGEVADTYTIKQIGGNLPNSDLVTQVPGIPKFVPSQEYIVFLPEPSKSGFSSPIGLSQGRFEITAENGAKSVSNGHPASQLLHQAQQQALTAGSQHSTSHAHTKSDKSSTKITYDAFTQMLRAMGDES